MRAILIDPHAQTIAEVEHNGDFRQIYELIKAECFTTIRLDDRNALYLDDEGLYKPEQAFFEFGTYPQPLAGRGLILGFNHAGETVPATISIDTIMQNVKWKPNTRFTHTTTSEEQGEVMGRPGVRITVTPHFEERGE